MDSAIVNAIIVGACTLIAALITAYVLIRQYNIDHPKIDKKDLRIIKGQWKGIALMDAAPNLPQIEYKVSARINSTARVIRAEATLVSQYEGDEISDLIDISGILAHDRFLKFEFKGKDQDSRLQFGFSILELLPTGQKLIGKFVSFSPYLAHIITGTVELRRVGDY
jgi:hypothetical protein